jgi:uncharacterized membrane protein (DUF2068 family)
MQQEQLEQAQRKRPFGLYAIIVLQILNILALFTDIVRVQMGVAALALPNVQNARVLAVVNIVIAVILIAIIVGLWRYQYWAWFATMIVTGIALILGIWQYFNGGGPYLNLLLNSLVALYLNQRDLRRIFEDQHLKAVSA